MTDLNLRETMTDTEKARLNRGAMLDEDTQCLVEMADNRWDIITPETSEDAASWKVYLGRSILVVRPSYRVVTGVNPTGRFGKDKFTFILDDNGDVEEGLGNNDMIKDILNGVLRAFFGGKDKMPDKDPVHILVNEFELVRGLQARCDITAGASAKGTQYNNFRSWKIAS